MYYIGVDLGTSAVKLLLMEADGTIRNVVSKEYPLYFPHPGWSEQKPEDWWNAVVEGIQELVPEETREKVAGMSFGGQMHGLVMLDENDEVIRPAILWNDGRTGKETNYLNEVIGAFRVHRQHRFCRLYCPEDSLGKRERAGKFCPDQQDHAAEGLPGLPFDRNLLHGRVRCLRYADFRCEKQMLV